MSIAKPFTFVANTYAKASEVNANFDTVYSQVNTNISGIAQNATDIDNLENTKADINGDSSEVFAVADPVASSQAVNKQTLMKAIGNSLDYISGLVITKDSGNPEDTIIVSAGSCYDSTHAVVLALANSLSKQNLNQGANATYYVYIIGTSNGNLTDILISTSSTTPTLPTGYTLFRQIGSYTTNSDSEIKTISYYGIDSSSNKNQKEIIYQTGWQTLTANTSFSYDLSGEEIINIDPELWSTEIVVKLTADITGIGDEGTIVYIGYSNWVGSAGSEGDVGNWLSLYNNVLTIRTGDNYYYFWTHGGINYNQCQVNVVIKANEGV